jgi:hypothetical protein
MTIHVLNRLFPFKNVEVLFGENSESGTSKEPNDGVYFVSQQRTFPKQTWRPLPD